MQRTLKNRMFSLRLNTFQLSNTSQSIGNHVNLIRRSNLVG
jgi:hypothetical protein